MNHPRAGHASTRLVAAAALAFSVAAEARPKVCLVLSGGGARGAAHVGVIKVLQELHVPIDCVAGTSMGSIVGGAYATGLTTAEMEKTLAEISTRTLLEEKPPRQDQAIRRKLDDRAQLFPVEAGLDERGISLQKGALSGHRPRGRAAPALDRGPVTSTSTSCRFPIARSRPTSSPARRSSSARASWRRSMRASMSVPGAIAPAEIGGQLLVDGGLTNNLPVDVARAMGADIVIAVNLGTPLASRESIQTSCSA